MGHTICLLTATLLAGQSGDVKVTRQTKIIVPQQSSAAPQQPIYNRSPLSKLRNWWEQNRPNLFQRASHRVNGQPSPEKQPQRPYLQHRTQFRPQKGLIQRGAPVQMKTNEPPLANGKKTVVKYQPVVNSKNVPAGNLRLSQKYENSVGAGEKHTWITGQLRKHGRMWVLIYAPDNVVDRYNGRVVLSSQADMSQFRDGEIVHVRGAAESRQVDGMHLYRTNSVDRIPNLK